MSLALRTSSTWWTQSRGGVDRPSPSAFVALLGFTFVLLLAPQETIPALAALHLAAVAALAAIGAHLWDRLSRGLPVLVVPRGVWPAVGLGAWALITVPFSMWPGGSISFFTDLFVKSLLICWLLPQVVDRESRLVGLVVGLCGAGAVIAATAVYHMGPMFLAGRADAVKEIIAFDAPLTRNPNDLALLTNLLLPLTVALVHVGRRLWMKVVCAAVVVVEVTAIVVSFSRAGFVTLAVVWIGHALRTLRGAARAAVIAAVVIVLAGPALLPEGYTQHLGTTLDVDADPTGSSQARWKDAVAASDVITDSPLVGAGLGQNILAITQLTGTWRQVHNVYLQVGADLGLPGLALFLALLVSCLGAARSVGANIDVLRAPSPLVHIARGLELSLWAFVVAGLFHPAAYHFYIYYIGGLALAARAIREEQV
jgi:O-antigen ligase